MLPRGMIGCIPIVLWQLHSIFCSKIMKTWPFFSCSEISKFCYNINQPDKADKNYKRVWNKISVWYAEKHPCCILQPYRTFNCWRFESFPSDMFLRYTLWYKNFELSDMNSYTNSSTDNDNEKSHCMCRRCRPQTLPDVLPLLSRFIW